MGEDERVIAELNKRADDLIGETERVLGRLAALQPDVDSARQQCAAAARQYAVAHARLDEQPVLMQLAARVGRRQVIFAQRSEVAQLQANSELELHQINTALFATQMAIGVGKLAEVGLSIYGWAAQSGKVLTTIEAEIQAGRGVVTPAANAAVQAADAARTHIDAARLQVDAAKSITASASVLVQSATDANKPMGAGDIAAGIAQVLALVLRAKTQFRNSGKTIWDAVSLGKRIQKVSDIRTVVSTILHELKMCMDVLKLLIDFIEDGQRQVDRSGMSSWAGGAASVLSILRDLWDAGTAFVEAYRAFEEMGENLRRLESFTAASAGFAGSEEAARAALPALSGLREQDIETLALNTSTYNGARVLVDAARQECQRIGGDVAAALDVQRRQNRMLAQVLRRGSGDLDSMRQLLARMRMQMADLGFVEDRGGPRGFAARQIKERLARQRARFEAVVSDWSSLLDATATVH